MARLIDTSRRNNLLYFRDLKTGTLDISACDGTGLDRLLAGEEVLVHDLWPPEADFTRLAAQAREIRRRAQSNDEERGLQTLFMAAGMASWPADDEGRPPQSAVLLLPINIKSRSHERAFSLQRTGDAQVNPTLLHVLATEHECTLTEESLLSGNDIVDRQSVKAALERLTVAGNQVEGFSIFERFVIGNYSFQKLSMVRDLKDEGVRLLSHDVVASLAGDIAARLALDRDRSENNVALEELDRIRANDEFLVLDADSSQQRVIASVLRGQCGVIQGPPGTGKSQTIANLIATLAAAGKRVLFVAEKRAALEVVMHRLTVLGLDHLVLDLHGADVSQRAVMQKMRDTLDVVHSVRPVASDGLHEEFERRRKQLNEHAERIHVARQPSNFSVYQLEGKLLRGPHDPVTRWHGAELDRLNETVMRRVHDLFSEAGNFSDLFLGTTTSPWMNSSIDDGRGAHAAVSLVSKVLSETLPAYEAALSTFVRVSGAAHTSSILGAMRAVKTAEVAARILASYDAEVFASETDSLHRTLGPAARSRVSAFVAWLRPSFRAARHCTLAMRRSPAPLRVLVDELAEAQKIRESWRESFTPPVAVVATEAVSTALASLKGDLSRFASLVDLGPWETNEIQGVTARLHQLAADRDTPFRIPRFRELERELNQLGVAKVLRECRNAKVAPLAWPEFCEAAWLASCLDAARATDPLIAGFSGQHHETVASDFKRLDRERVKLAIDRVRRMHAERAVDAMNQHPEQAAVVRREAEKKTRHMPLRRLVAEAPEVLTAVCPCWMASPLSVSQLLPSDRQYFDYVLFDEGSQVLPEDAVPAILRAHRVVVAGDSHQLPPTTFFADGSSDGDFDEDEVSNVEGFESVLDIMSTFVQPWSLDWHYRSRDERLIAFSNHYIYRDRLITFPGPGGAWPAVSHEFVEQNRGTDGEEESGAAEVRRVVELVLDHARTRPEETLGVITMGIKHAQRVQAALDAAQHEREDVDEFFSSERRERFFVKNLERVQGDERDAIILTIGYGKDRGGNLRHTFGPLLHEGGERRLNVAVTRARSRMTVVSSFLASDVDPARAKGRGVQLLRSYLEFAASQGALLGQEHRTSEPLNDFEADIYDALTARGISIEPQWGVSGYRIDLAAKHPSSPGRFVLAIECDGASYHSAPTARDRDRLRQQQLEALGWRFHRIWSTDWFQRRQDEIARTVAAYDKAVAFADDLDAGKIAIARKFDQHVGDAARHPLPETIDASQRRVPRPILPVLNNILLYSPEQIERMVLHIKSDGLLRSDEELIRLTAHELGFASVKKNIRARIGQAVARVRAVTRQ